MPASCVLWFLTGRFCYRLFSHCETTFYTSRYICGFLIQEHLFIHMIHPLYPLLDLLILLLMFLLVMVPLPVTGRGILGISSFHVLDVAHVPRLTMQLISGGQIVDSGCRVILDFDSCSD